MIYFNISFTVLSIVTMRFVIVLINEHVDDDDDDDDDDDNNVNHATHRSLRQGGR